MSPDLQGRIDGTISANLLSGFPDQSSSRHDCDVVLVPISLFHDFKFNPLLRDINKPWVLIDYLEYEWCCDMSHFIGRNTRECRWLSPAWWEFDEFAKEHPPAMYFKRELLSREVTDRIKPIDWPCYIGQPPVQSEDEFNARPIEVFFSWGFSHPSRPRMHAQIFHAMTTHSIGVISELNQFEHYFRSPCARTWASVFTPWYARSPIERVIWFQQRSKISVSLPGAGKKCFRHAEAPVATIMALQDDYLAWSYPWIDGSNCIRLAADHGSSVDDSVAFEDLEDATKRADLYQIYLRSQETIDKYRTKPYINQYVIPLIQNAL